MYEVTSMQVTLGWVKIEQYNEAVGEQLRKYIYPVMLMDSHPTLKLLGVTSTAVKLQVN